MIRSVSLLRIQKEWILPAVTRDSFNTYVSFLTRLLIFTAIFEPESWIKRSILCVLSVVKSQYKQDLHCSSYKEKNFDTTLLAPLARLYFNLQYISYMCISRLVFIWPVWSIILKLTVQNTMKELQTCDLVSNHVILSPVSMEMSEK